MVAYDWQKSSHCGEGNSCLNVAFDRQGAVKIRESAVPDSIVTTTPAMLRTFIESIKEGKFDHPAADSGARVLSS